MEQRDFERLIEQLARSLNIDEGFAFLLAIFFLVWTISWLFLPFSVWGISSKLGSLSEKLSQTRKSAENCADGISRLNDRVDSVISRLNQDRG